MIVEPCPVPRCALEWHLTGSLLMTAMFIWLIPFDGEAGHALGFRVGAQPIWSALFAACGLAHLTALLLKHQALQRWSAAAGFVVCFLATATILSSDGSPPLFVALAIPTTLAEGYVYLLLKGTRWKPLSSAG
jgi:hypothetical protein